MTTLPNFKLSLCAACLVELNKAAVRSKKAKEKEKRALGAGVQIAVGRNDFELLEQIAEWKSPRRRALLKENSQSARQEALDVARSSAGVSAKIEALCQLQGVRVPMASAILTAIDPFNYTVIDVRALDTLGVHVSVNLAKLYPSYLEFCAQKAKSYGMSLRDFDRALWKAGSA